MCAFGQYSSWCFRVFALYVTRTRSFSLSLPLLRTVFACVQAGPGTIAEAMCRSLPTMLSCYLPGQEAGNIPFVVDNGFGAYSKKPEEIAATVAKWMSDDELVRGNKNGQMSNRKNLVPSPCRQCLWGAAFVPQVFLCLCFVCAHACM